MISKVSISDKEPNEIYRYCLNSLTDFLAAPSAILVGTETLALLNWLIKPNFSSGGNAAVSLYTSSTSCILSCHAFNFLWGLSMNKFI